MLHKPRPIDAVLNVVNSLTAHAMIFAYLPRGSCINPYFSDLIFRQFCKSMSFAARAGVVSNRVLHVAGPSVPSKIRGAVVQAVAVIVAAVGFAWGWPMERLQYQAMNVARMLLIQLPQIHHLVFSSRGNCSDQNSLGERQSSARGVWDDSCQGFNPANIADFVNALKTNDGQPVFLHVRPPIAKAPCDECVAAARNTAFRSNPSHTGELYGL